MFAILLRKQIACHHNETGDSNYLWPWLTLTLNPPSNPSSHLPSNPNKPNPYPRSYMILFPSSLPASSSLIKVSPNSSISCSIVFLSPIHTGSRICVLDFCTVVVVHRWFAHINLQVLIKKSEMKWTNLILRIWNVTK